MQKLDLLRRQFRWKLLVLRILVNSLALLVIAILVPNIYFVDKRFGVLLFAGVMFGVLNALIKPIIQFFTFRLIFASYGLVIVVINALMLKLLGVLFPSTLAVNGILWALIGGALIGLVASFLENLLGVNPPLMLLAEQKARKEDAAAIEGRQGLMGMMIGLRSETTAAKPEFSTTEVSDEKIDARQDTGKPATPAGI